MKKAETLSGIKVLASVSKISRRKQLRLFFFKTTNTREIGGKKFSKLNALIKAFHNIINIIRIYVRKGAAEVFIRNFFKVGHVFAFS